MSAVSAQNLSVEFEALEAAICETSRGGWFLDEYARKVRGTDTVRVFQSIEKLSAQITDKTHASQFDILRLELEAMAAGIARTRREIAYIKPRCDVPGSDRIITATEELDLVLSATENATAEILTAAESLQALSGKVRESGGDAAVCDEIDNHATNLMVACSFQDLTGQRMTKVVNALRYIEQRVNSMIAIWGVTDADANGTREQTDRRPDAHLLNGPQRAGDGVAQVDVDRLLTRGDAPPTPGAPAPASAATTSSQNDIDALFG